jgi:hypothetical protein
MDMSNRSEQNPAGQTGDQTIFLQRAPLVVPLNLSEWVEPELLAHWIGEALDGLDTGKPEVQELLRQTPESRPKAMLAVLMFAYSTQVYISEEIFRACHEDAMLHALCDGKPPFPEELEHCRRKHRVLLQDLLAQLLVRAVREKFVEMGQIPPGLQHSLLGRAADRLDTARHMDTWDE